MVLTGRRHPVVAFVTHCPRNHERRLARGIARAPVAPALLGSRGFRTVRRDQCRSAGPALVSGPGGPTTSDASVRRFQRHHARFGYTFWAVQVLESERGPAHFIGSLGLIRPTFKAPFAHSDPLVEIGWRLHPDWWGLGLATEAAAACLDYAFGRAHLAEVVSFTVPPNLASQAVMQRIGMQYDGVFERPVPTVPGGARTRCTGRGPPSLTRTDRSTQPDSAKRTAASACSRVEGRSHASVPIHHQEFKFRAAEDDLPPHLAARAVR